MTKYIPQGYTLYYVGFWPSLPIMLPLRQPSICMGYKSVFYDPTQSQPRVPELETFTIMQYSGPYVKEHSLEWTPL